MKPLGVTDRYRLRDLKITPSMIVPDGKVIWWAGRKRLQIGTFENIAIIPTGATDVTVSIENYRELRAALYPPREPSTILAAG